MSTVATETRVTPEELLAMPDGDRYELVNYRLVERRTGQKSSRIGGRIFGLLANFCEDRRMHWIYPADAGYQCFPDDPGKVRKPNVSFIREERQPVEEEPEEYCRIPPDLAVAVVSPNDLAYEVDVWVRDLLEAGVRIVWEVHPVTRTIQVHRADGTSAILRAQDEITGEDVLPGFRCQVRDMFQSAADLDHS